jgi:hypothetical protein
VFALVPLGALRSGALSSSFDLPRRALDQNA